MAKCHLWFTVNIPFVVTSPQCAISRDLLKVSGDKFAELLDYAMLVNFKCDQHAVLHQYNGHLWSTHSAV